MKIIDVHVYYGKWYFPIPAKSIEDILEIMSRRGIEKAILMSSVSILQDFREGNRTLFDRIKNHDNLFGYCFVNGNYIEESLQEMDKYLPLDKCKGIKYHPEYSGKRPNAPDVMPIFSKAAHQYKKAALIHSWPYGEHGNPAPNSHPRFIANLAGAIPELKIIMGHMGGPEWMEAIEVAKPFANIYLDIGSSYTHFDKIKVAVDRLGAHRVIFGSGMTEACIDAHIGAVLESEITAEEKAVLLYEGAKILFDL